MTLPTAPDADSAEPFGLGARVLHGVFRCLGALPLAWRRALGIAAGEIFALFPTRERKIAELQLRVFLPNADVRKTVRGIFRNVAQTAAESLNMAAILNDPAIAITPTDPEIFAEILNPSRPILGLTAHTGNWELLAAYLVDRGCPLVTVGRPARIPALHAALLRLRNDARLKVIWRDEKNAVREMIRTFSQTKPLGVLIDQDTRVTGLSVPFFGHPAHTPSTVVDLGLRHGASIFSAFITRAGRGFEFHLRPITGTSPQEVLTEYNRHLEELLRRFPDQWVWFHKRWRTQPSGERMSGKAYMHYLAGLLNQDSR